MSEITMEATDKLIFEFTVLWDAGIDQLINELKKESK